ASPRTDQLRRTDRALPQLRRYGRIRVAARRVQRRELQATTHRAVADVTQERAGEPPSPARFLVARATRGLPRPCANHPGDARVTRAMRDTVPAVVAAYRPGQLPTPASPPARCRRFP